MKNQYLVTIKIVKEVKRIIESECIDDAAMDVEQDFLHYEKDDFEIEVEDVRKL
jgi:hypothetical protein